MQVPTTSSIKYSIFDNKKICITTGKTNTLNIITNTKSEINSFSLFGKDYMLAYDPTSNLTEFYGFKI